MVTYLLKKSYQLKDLKQIEFQDLWGDHGIFTTMWIFGKPPKILFFERHIKNLILSKLFIHKFIIDIISVLEAVLTFFDFFNTSLLSGFLFGLISVVVPWFFFLPATGKGLMGNKTPNPKLTKVLSTCSHVVVGLFLAIGFSLMEY